MAITSCLTDVPHPGEFLREELDARGWSQRDLAFILGMPEQAVNLIISGKRGISPEMAKALGNAFDVSAEYFANLQKAHEMANARAPDPAIARRAALQGFYPIREMIRRDWLVESDVDLLESQLLRFFCKNSLTDIPGMAYAAKKSDYKETNAAEWAWLFRVRQISSEMVVPKFSKESLQALIQELPRYMVDPEEVRHIPRALAECGIRFAVVETLPKANIDGVCFWLDRDSPTVGMTTRHDRIDNFWFVLRHELEHVLQRDGEDHISAESVDVALEGERAGTGNDLSAEERRANRAAADSCVPIEELQSFYERKFPFISERDMLGFAQRVQRHPGIVVGQLQFKMKRHDWLNRRKAKIRAFLVGNSIMDGWGNPAPVSL